MIQVQIESSVHIMTNDTKKRENARRVGLRLRELRKTRQLTQAELADEVGVSQALVSKVERGERELSVSSAKRIAELYGVDVAELYGSESDSGIVGSLLEAWTACDNARGAYSWLRDLAIEMSIRLDRYQQGINELESLSPTGLPRRLGFDGGELLASEPFRREIETRSPADQIDRLADIRFPIVSLRETTRATQLFEFIGLCEDISDDDLQSLLQLSRSAAHAGRNRLQSTPGNEVSVRTGTHCDKGDVDDV